MEKYEKLKKMISELLSILRKSTNRFSLRKFKWPGEDEKLVITENEVDVWNKFIDIMQNLNWALKFDDMKEIVYKNDNPIINQQNCGTLVKVRPCGNEYEKKTYLGILLGDIALNISHSIDEKGIVTFERGRYNPAIFIPETRTIVYGCESWWGEIESEDELKQITDDDIENVWYVKMLKKMQKNE